MQLARPIRKLIESFERLPGIGPKTAQRLAFYLLHVPQEQLEEFGHNLSELKKNTVFCSLCLNVAETDPCGICIDTKRDKTVICVVESPLDVLALEKTGEYRGLYHVLHGAISPLNNIGPDEIHIRELMPRVEGGIVTEIILAMNPNMEGEATAMYVQKQLRITLAGQANSQLRITRLGMGLPTGGDLEYADENTLSKAIQGRREY